MKSIRRNSGATPAAAELADIEIRAELVPDPSAMREDFLPAFFLQAPFWARFKGKHGWNPYFFKAEMRAPRLPQPSFFYGSVLTRVFLRRFRLAYVPMFPDAEFLAVLAGTGKSEAEAGATASGNATDDCENNGNGENTDSPAAISAIPADSICALLAKLAAALKPLLPKDVFLLRFDPDWSRSLFASGAVRLRKKRGFPMQVFKAAADIQPPDTVLVSLAESEEAISARMKPKWRYNIRLAEKKGVEVLCFRGSEALAPGALRLADTTANPNPGADADGKADAAARTGGGTSALDVFYSLYLETARRDGIAIHGGQYYRSLFEVCAGADNPEKGAGRDAAENQGAGRETPADIRLYLARHDGDALAAIITLFYGGKAVYLYGASSGKKRALMPAYALQWHAMRDAKAAGCTQYDLYGIPPTDDEHHPMHGLYRFKTGFGGEIVHRAGSLDVPCKGNLYRLYRAAERARIFWFKRVAKMLKPARGKSSGGGERASQSPRTQAQNAEKDGTPRG